MLSFVRRPPGMAPLRARGWPSNKLVAVMTLRDEYALQLSRLRNRLRSADYRWHPVRRAAGQSGLDRLVFKVVKYRS